MGKMSELDMERQRILEVTGGIPFHKQWPNEGCELVEHDEPGLQGLFKVRYIPTGKVLRDRLHQTDAFKLVQFGFDLLLETMDAMGERRLKIIRGEDDEDSRPVSPAEGGEADRTESE